MTNMAHSGPLVPIGSQFRPRRDDRSFPGPDGRPFDRQARNGDEPTPQIRTEESPGGQPRREPPNRMRLTTEDENNLRTAVGLLQELVDSDPSVPQFRYLLAQCLRELADDGFVAASGPDGDSMQTAIDLLEALVAEYPSVPEYRHALAGTYAKFDVQKLIRDNRDLLRAEQALSTALDHGKQLVDAHPRVPAYTASLIHIYHKLATIQERMARFVTPELHRERTAKAERNLRAAAELQASLIRSFPAAPAYRIWYARFQISLARMLGRGRRLDEARAVLDTTIQSLKTTIQAGLDQPKLHGMLAHLYQQLSDTLDRIGETDLAINAALDAVEHREQAGDSLQYFENQQVLPPNDGPRRRFDRAGPKLKPRRRADD